jgi:hypothetical protein
VSSGDWFVLLPADGHTGFDLERLAPLAARRAATFAEPSFPYVGIPEGNRSSAFARA